MSRLSTAAPYVLSASLVITGLIHLPPLVGVFGSERLASLYGLSFNESNLTILMRHRAILFGVLGTFMIFAAFKPVYQSGALVAGFISVVSFLWLAAATGSYNAAIARVVTADIVALVCLLIGVTAHLYVRSQR
jgi:hypothetical protein